MSPIRSATLAAAILVGAAGPAAARDLVDHYAAALGVALAEPRDGFAAILAARPVDAEEMEEMRGGFTLPNGLSVRFGFDIETRVNGLPVQRLTLLPTLITPQAAPVIQVTQAGAATQTMALPARGAAPVQVETAANQGATRVMTQIAPTGVVGVVQNRADGARVDRRTSVDVDIAGMRGMLDRAATRTMVGSALATGRRNGR